MEECALHRDHGSARPAILVTHHIVPLGMDGPDVATNKIRICDNGHRSVHTVLAALVFDRPIPVGVGCRTERALAREGFDRWVALGRPGNAHAAYALAGGHP